MKKLTYLLLLICSTAFADTNNPLNITEEDGSPSVYPYKLKFTNATVTDGGDGTASISVTGAGGDIEGVTAGTGLVGGGTTGTVTLDVGDGVGITISSDGVALNATEVNTTTFMAGESSAVWTFNTTGTDPTITFSSNSIALAAALTVNSGASTGQISIGSAGGTISDDGDGLFTFAGTGNGSDESFTMNLDDTSNVISIASGTGVTKFDFGSIGLASTVNMPGNPKHLRFTIMQPLEAQTEDNEICIWNKTDAALTVSSIEVSLDSSANQIVGDLKFADTFVGLANPVIINDFDTTSGVRSDSSMSGDATVPAGKAIYLSFYSAPNTAIKQANFDVTYSYD